MAIRSLWRPRIFSLVAGAVALERAVPRGRTFLQTVRAGWGDSTGKIIPD
jgi:hypothetical protein